MTLLLEQYGKGEKIIINLIAKEGYPDVSVDGQCNGICYDFDIAGLELLEDGTHQQVDEAVRYFVATKLPKWEVQDWHRPYNGEDYDDDFGDEYIDGNFWNSDPHS